MQYFYQLRTMILYEYITKYVLFTNNVLTNIDNLRKSAII